MFVARYAGAPAFIVTLFLASAVPLAAQPLPMGEPEELGFSTERLSTMRRTMERFVDDGHYSGVSWLVARRGKIVTTGAYGLRDMGAQLPMESDTIFRIYSMSKIVTSVAALILFEEGRFGLEDPVSRYLPELADMQVFVGGTADAPLLETARKPITINELFTHTSGFHYGQNSRPELAALFTKAFLAADPSLESFVRRAATVPLAHHPGESRTYGISSDILGRVVEVVSGVPFEDFLAERIFEPLGMTDTSFSVPPEKRGRLAKIYEAHNGRLEETDLRKGSVILRVLPSKGSVPPMGGGGLFSTIGDFARLSQMLLNGGELDDHRILGRKTVELMTANRIEHLPEGYDNRVRGRGLGIGLSVWVTMELGRSPLPASVGQFGWSGGATTDCAIDPQEEIIALVFAQHFPYNEHQLLQRFTTGYMQALVD